MYIKITPQYLQNGHRIGYKAETIYRTKHIIAMSFTSHNDAINRLFANIYKHIGTIYGTNELKAFINNPLK